MRIEYHRTLLADQVRNAAFHEALRRVIVKGETTVADIGAGTGFLGFLAAKLGAKRVDFYETAEIADVARKLLRHNRLANCRIAQMHSTDVAAPDRVDVVVSETLGNYPFEENIIATLNDAHARFLESRRRDHSARRRAIRLSGNGQALPVRACGVGRCRLWPRLRAGQGNEPQQHLRALVRARRSAGRRRRGQCLGQGRLRPPQQDDALRRSELAARRATTVYGLALWWSAELAPACRCRPGRSIRARTGSSSICPALAPIAVEPGQTLAARLRSTTSYEQGTNVTWMLAVRDNSGREVLRQALDLEKGFLP